MKWKTTPLPSDGDVRTRTKFALFPVELDNGYTVWLEIYTVIERYYTFSFQSDKWMIQKREEYQ